MNLALEFPTNQPVSLVVTAVEFLSFILSLCCHTIKNSTIAFNHKSCLFYFMETYACLVKFMYILQMHSNKCTHAVQATATALNTSSLGFLSKQMRCKSFVQIRLNPAVLVALIASQRDHTGSSTTGVIAFCSQFNAVC